jgi:hypothetical protein
VPIEKRVTVGLGGPEGRAFLGYLKRRLGSELSARLAHCYLEDEPFGRRFEFCGSVQDKKGEVPFRMSASLSGEHTIRAVRIRLEPSRETTRARPSEARERATLAALEAVVKAAADEARSQPLQHFRVSVIVKSGPWPLSVKVRFGPFTLEPVPLKKEEEIRRRESVIILERRFTLSLGFDDIDQLSALAHAEDAISRALAFLTTVLRIDLRSLPSYNLEQVDKWEQLAEGTEGSTGPVARPDLRPRKLMAAEVQLRIPPDLGALWDELITCPGVEREVVVNSCALYRAALEMITSCPQISMVLFLAAIETLAMYEHTKERRVKTSSRAKTAPRRKRGINDREKERVVEEFMRKRLGIDATAIAIFLRKAYHERSRRLEPTRHAMDAKWLVLTSGLFSEEAELLHDEAEWMEMMASATIIAHLTRRTSAKSIYP